MKECWDDLGAAPAVGALLSEKRYRDDFDIPSEPKPIRRTREDDRKVEDEAGPASQ
jgi:hypothetical protein